jgi:hypothetical protein
MSFIGVIVFRSEDKKQCLALQVRHSSGSIVLLALAVPLVLALAVLLVG